MKNLCRHPASRPLVGESETVDADQYGHQIESEVGNKIESLCPVVSDCVLAPECPDGSRATWTIFGEDISN